jgi:hypothetical protein
MKNKNVYPKGWDAQRVKAVIEHYENQTEDEAVREYEAAEGKSCQTMMSVPKELLPAVRAFISSATSKHKPARKACKAPAANSNRRQLV